MNKRKYALVTLLYEDARSQVFEPGLHKLIVSSVWDTMGSGAERFVLEQSLDARCMKGVDRILAVCQSDLADIAGDGRRVAAVVDEDVIRKKLKMSPTTSVPQIVEQIRSKCPESARGQLSVFVLKWNTETVLQAARDCASGLSFDLLDPDLVKRALDKELLARDQVLGRVAQQNQAAIRACILERVPALKDLVSWISEVIKEARLADRAFVP